MSRAQRHKEAAARLRLSFPLLAVAAPSQRLAPWTISYAQIFARYAKQAKKRAATGELLANFAHWNADSGHFHTCLMGAPHRHGLAPPETLFLDHYSAQKVATWGGPRNRRSCRAAVFVQLQRALIACNGVNNVEICIEHGLNATKGVRRLTIWVMDDIEYPWL